MQRTVAAADFGNGISRIVDFDTHMFINPDLTVSLSRVPVGDWIGLESSRACRTQATGKQRHDLRRRRSDRTRRPVALRGVPLTAATGVRPARDLRRQ